MDIETRHTTENPLTSRVKFNRTRIHRTVSVQVCEARRLKKAKGVFCTVHCQDLMYRTETVWFTRNPTWSDEFTFTLARPGEVLKIFIHEERKKGSNKKIGEVKLGMETLAKNERVEKWYPVVGRKGDVEGDVRIRATYAVDVILPSQYYEPLLDLILDDRLVVVRLLAEASKDKVLLAQELVHIFYARNKIDHLIQNFIDDELSHTNSPEVLFRSNTVCTKMIDVYMKLTGTNYLKSVLGPVIDMLMKQKEPFEIQKERIKEGDDYTKNVEHLRKLSDFTLQRIYQSSMNCPPAIRRAMTYLYYSTPRFLNNQTGTIKYLAVSSFIFLRFFVPALLNPKLFGLTETMPDEAQSRICTLLSGVLQKIANLTKYREQDLYVSLLNPFLESQLENTKEYIDFICDSRKGSNFMTPSQLTPLQVDRNLASLLRHFSKCKDKFVEAAATHKEAVKILNILGELDKLLEKEKQDAESEEIGIIAAVPSMGYKDIDILVSKMIETDLSSPESKRMTIIRKKSDSFRNISIAAKVKNLMPGRKRRMRIDKAPKYERLQQRSSSEKQKRADVSNNEIEFRHRYENSPLRQRVADEDTSNKPESDFKVNITPPLTDSTTPYKDPEDDIDMLIAQQFEDEEEEDEEEEVEVVVMNYNPEQFETTVKEIDSIVNEINSVPLAPKKPRNLSDASNILPEFGELDNIITNIRRTIYFTTPKRFSGVGNGILCNYCKDPIEGGSKYLIALNHAYHEHHLLCTTCGKDVGDIGFHISNDLPYCVDCYSKNYGKYPLCAYCNEPILDASFTFALNKNWHPEHFICTVCGCDFEDGVFYNIEDRPYCHQHRTAKSQPNLPRCAHCHGPIYDEVYIEAFDHIYHTDHFCCDICHKNLSGTFVPFKRPDGTNGKACEDHFVNK